MGLRWHNWTTVVAIAAVAAVVVVAPIGAAGASRTGEAARTPEAELSINPTKGALSVVFVAGAMGFSDRVVSYHWAFGDGASSTTTTDVVTHRYRSTGRFSPTVTETDKQGQHATARGSVALFKCKAGEATCRATLPDAANVAILTASGPQGPAGPASATLFVGPFRIIACEATVAEAVALTDTRDLRQPDRHAEIHERRSEAVDRHLFLVRRRLRRCDRAQGPQRRPSPMPEPRAAPCVKSVTVDASMVSKVLLIPPATRRSVHLDGSRHGPVRPAPSHADAPAPVGQGHRRNPPPVSKPGCCQPPSSRGIPLRSRTRHWQQSPA